jgi:outer membrane immunogenic protein
MNKAWGGGLAIVITLLGTSAGAAPATLAAPATWAGFYAGVHAGWIGMDKDWFVYLNGAGTHHTLSGVLGGGQIGFNWQTGNWVLGIEGDASGMDLSGSSICPQITFTCRTTANWLATVAGRAGYAFGPALLFVKGGAAWAGEKFAFVPNVGGVSTAETSQTRSGWTLGGGVEYAFAPNWSVKVEYDYFGFGSKDVSISGVVANIDQTAQRAIVGINYHFGIGTR